MSVNFCIVSGRWPKTCGFGCGSESPIPLEGRNPIPLGTLGQAIEQRSLSPAAIVQCLNRFEDSKMDGEHEIERFRTFFALMQSEAICCINFIPLDPHELQTIQVMRLRQSEVPKNVSVYSHSNIYKYILPVERADYVFDLSKEKVSDTTQCFKGSLETIIGKGLGYFIKDRQAKGIALTIQETGNQKNYIWLK